MKRRMFKILLAIFALTANEAKAQFFLKDPAFEKQLPHPHKKFTHCAIKRSGPSDYDYEYTCHSPDLICFVSVSITDKPEFRVLGCAGKWHE